MRFVRTTQLMAALQWRRFSNRGQSVLRKKATEPRSGTARKGGLGILLLLFLALVFGFQSIIFACVFLKEVSVAFGPLRDKLDRIEVSVQAYDKLQELSTQNSGRGEEKTNSITFTDEAFTDEGAGFARKHSNEWAQIVQKQFDERGLNGFVATKSRTGFYFLPVLSAWLHPEAGPVLIKTVGAVLALLSLMRFCMLLGTSQDLGKVEWQSEWFFTLPVPSQHVFGAQILGSALVDTFSWVVALPLLSVVLFSAGFGWGSIPVALLGVVYLGVAVSALQVTAETQLRKRFSPINLKNLQALFSISGSVLFFLLYFILNTPAPVHWLVGVAQKSPWLLAMNPFSLPALMCGTGVPLVIAFELALGAAFVWAASRYCTRLVSDGLVSSPNAYHGTRGTTATGPEKGRSVLPEGIVGKELRLLSRDRNLFAQIFIVPLLIAAMQLVLLDSGFARTIVSNFQAASAFAYGLGAYVLIGSLQVLVVEGNSLWMLYAMPVSIHRILLRKTLLWACLGVLYTGLALVVCGVMMGSVALKSLAFGAMACAGIFIYAFIGAGIGILGSNPLETEVHRRVKVSSVYLYMLLAAMYGYALYAPSLWTRLGQLVLSSLLAYALWQKVRDREPFLLDPVSAPPPRVSLADGMIAALAFFVLQGVISVVASGQRMSKGSAMTLSFVLAGALIAAFYLLTYRRTPAFLSVPEGSKKASVSAALGFGLMGGGIAGGFGLLFIFAMERVPFLQQLEGAGASPVQNVRGWGLLLLTLVAAPLFEEFIFRGLLFRGMRRSLPLGISVLGSAAVFALCHPPVAVVPVFAMAVLAAWSFARSGRLASAMALHATYNAIVIMVPMLFFTTTPPFNKAGRDDESKHHSELGEEIAARAGGSVLTLTEPAKGRADLVHFATYRGGMKFSDPSFDLWVPTKLMPEYSVLPKDKERFGWLAGQFQNQLQNGDVLSGNDLGILYLYGLGVEKNWEIARGYFVQPIKERRWVGQRFLAELVLMTAQGREDARLGAELVLPMIEAKNWLGLWAALRAHDILVASDSVEDRALADRLIRLCVDGVHARLEQPPTDKAKRQDLFERVELITQSLLGNPDAEDLRLAEVLLEKWIGVESDSMEARLYRLRLRMMRALKAFDGSR